MSRAERTRYNKALSRYWRQRERGWMGSPSSYKAISFSQPSNKFLRNIQAIPPYDSRKDRHCLASPSIFMPPVPPSTAPAALSPTRRSKRDRQKSKRPPTPFDARISQLEAGWSLNPGLPQAIPAYNSLDDTFCSVGRSSTVDETPTASLVNLRRQGFKPKARPMTSSSVQSHARGRTRVGNASSIRPSTSPPPPLRFPFRVTGAPRIAGGIGFASGDENIGVQSEPRLATSDGSAASKIQRPSTSPQKGPTRASSGRSPITTSVGARPSSSGNVPSSRPSLNVPAVVRQPPSPTTKARLQTWVEELKRDKITVTDLAEVSCCSLASKRRRLLLTGMLSIWVLTSPARNR